MNIDQIEKAVIAFLIFGVVCFIVILVARWLDIDPVGVVSGIALYLSISASINTWMEEGK